MKEYDESSPLILIHIPKTAGVSVKEVYKEWFGERLLLHYFDRKTNSLPQKYDIDFLQTRESPVFIYGHFNKARNFGIEQYYPTIDQFITILRDPFEMAVSGFFYVRKTNENWRKYLNLPKGELKEHLEKMHSGLLNFFPQEVTGDNYKEMIEEKFVEIGVTEHLDKSMIRIAKKLNQQYIPGSLAKLNVSQRDQDVPYNLKEAFIGRHQLEYEIYNFVLSRYT